MMMMKVQDRPMTRRGILSVVNSIYDPLGFLAPVVLPAKLLLKELCKEQHGWDDSIDEKHTTVWRKWKENVVLLSNFHVVHDPPSQFHHPKANQQMHSVSQSKWKGW